MAYADEKVFLWINGLVGKFTLLDEAVKWVVSDYMVPVGLALALVGMWFIGKDQLTRQKHQIGVFVALSSMGFSSLSVFIINAVYFRPRPFADHDVSLLFYEPTDSSFPANAVAVTFGIAIGVWGVNRRLGTAWHRAHRRGQPLRPRPRVCRGTLPTGHRRGGRNCRRSHVPGVQAQRLLASHTHLGNQGGTNSLRGIVGAIPRKYPKIHRSEDIQLEGVGQSTQ